MSCPNAMTKMMMAAAMAGTTMTPHARRKTARVPRMTETCHAVAVVAAGGGVDAVVKTVSRSPRASSPLPPRPSKLPCLVPLLPPVRAASGTRVAPGPAEAAGVAAPVVVGGTTVVDAAAAVDEAVATSASLVNPASRARRASPSPAMKKC